jgi:hypothetical protein
MGPGNGRPTQGPVGAAMASGRERCTSLDTAGRAGGGQAGRPTATAGVKSHFGRRPFQSFPPRVAAEGG